MRAIAGALLLAITAGLSTTVAAQYNEPQAIDGDTFRYNGETIRLLGIDTPEMPGHCRVGRGCAPGDPFAARLALQTLLERGKLTILRVKKDRYGRTVAAVRANRVDISCSLLRGKFGIYKAAWDDYGIIRQRCHSVVQPTLTRPTISAGGERG